MIWLDSRHISRPPFSLFCSQTVFLSNFCVCFHLDHALTWIFTGCYVPTTGIRTTVSQIGGIVCWVSLTKKVWAQSMSFLVNLHILQYLNFFCISKFVCLFENVCTECTVYLTPTCTLKVQRLPNTRKHVSVMCRGWKKLA